MLHEGSGAHRPSHGGLLSRRRLLTGAAAAGLLAAGCTVPRPPRPDGPQRWHFTDDTGRVVGAARRPRTIVAYSTAAAALWDYGVQVAGVYGALQTGGGGSDTSVLGAVDLDRTTVLGRTWGQINLEMFGRLSPDLVVDPLQFGAHHIEAGTLALVRRLAPIASLEIYRTSVAHAVHRYAQLAQALHGEAVTRHRPAYDAARRRLRAAAAARPGLRVLCASFDSDGVRIARQGWPLLTELKGLGVGVIVPADGESVFMQKLSWEYADRYPADLILMDARTSSLQQSQLADLRVWRALPAVRAGQTALWNPEPTLSYPAMARLYDALTTVLQGTRRLDA